MSESVHAPPPNLTRKFPLTDMLTEGDNDPRLQAHRAPTVCRLDDLDKLVHGLSEVGIGLFVTSQGVSEEAPQGSSNTAPLRLPGEMHRRSSRLHPGQGADTGFRRHQSAGQARRAGLAARLSSRICPADDITASRRGSRIEPSGGGSSFYARKS